MKNKKLIYCLILSVAAVWGIIFYRIFTASVSDETPVLAQNIPFTKVSLEDYEIRDTFALELNYRDPFSARSLKEEPTEQVAPAARKPVPPLPPVMSRDYIKYGGYIINPSTKMIVSILTINGREQMMSDGNVLGDVQLIKNYKDSVSILYKDKTYFIRKTN